MPHRARPVVTAARRRPALALGALALLGAAITIPTYASAMEKPGRSAQAGAQGGLRCVASFSSPPAGALTASGERFDPNSLTAASGSFPLGSTIEVTNLDTNKSVRVRVNDRASMCALLTPGAFERIRTPSKNLIRNGVVRQVG
jgi:Lytic transglycolase